MARDSYWIIVNSIDKALDAGECLAITERFWAKHPIMRRADTETIVEMLLDSGEYAPQAGTFNDGYFAELIALGLPGAALSYAEVAILAAGKELTMETLLDLLGRAGLIVS